MDITDELMQELSKSFLGWVREEEQKMADNFAELFHRKLDQEIAFNELFDLCNSCVIPLYYKDRQVLSENFPQFAEPIFSQIHDSFNRKGFLLIFMSYAYYLKQINHVRDDLKGEALSSYDKNWQQKIITNKNAALKVSDSLVSIASDQKTQTLKTLLEEYVAQCDELLKGEPILFRGLYRFPPLNQASTAISMKEYRIPPVRSKEPLENILNVIIAQTGIKATALQIKQLLEQINIQVESATS